MNILKRLLNRGFNISPEKTSDELLGFWENDAEDGSGLHALWGYGIEFLEDEKGFVHHWGQDIKPSERKILISWERIGATTIRIKFESDDGWSTVEYEITHFSGAYNSKHFKLTEKGKTSFWTTPQPLYKIRR